MSGDDVAIEIGSDRISGWKSVHITRSIEGFPSSFALRASEPFMDDPTRMIGDDPTKRVRVLIDDDLVITGYVDRYHVRTGPTSHDVMISGRGIGQDLVDCSADLGDAQLIGGQVSAASALDLAQKLAMPYGIECRQAAGEPGPPILAMSVALGETPYELIERVARYTQLLVYEDENGTLVLDKVGTESMASGFADRTGGNVEGAEVVFANDQRYSDIIVVWNPVARFAELGDSANQRYAAKDEAFKRKRLKIIVSEQIGDNFDYAKARAEWERARRIGRSQALSLTCDSWRDAAGKLWQINRLAPIDLPAQKLVGPERKWLIGSVTYRKDSGGTHADVVLMPPDAYRPQPQVLYLYDKQTDAALRSAAQTAPPGTPGSH